MTNDASYYYYAHDNLARTEYGDYNVEVQNYAFTIHGWEKAVLGNQFSYALGYYNDANDKDYTPIGDVSTAPVPLATPVSKGLYNSNIASFATRNRKIADNVQTELYEYDQMNRLVKSDIQGSANNNYSTAYEYDASTNLKTITRYDQGGTLFDNLSYNYETRKKGYLANTNKLRDITDAVPNSPYSGDLESQDADNYLYDEVGNLIYDDQEGTESLEWNANNKIRYVKRRATSSKPDIEFVYDANMKYRVAKIVRYKNGTTKTTFYVNDAAGNLLATYAQTNGGEVRIKEQYLYGAERLGTLKPGTNATIGNREYELKDNLTSIRATVSDLPVNGETEVTNAFDYYPYGMLARSYNSPDKYRYGYNGWERDDEMEKGEGNEYGTDFRQYDSRTARYSGVDPLAVTIAAYSPYSHALGNPIKFIDSEGDWPGKPSSALANMGVKLPPLAAGLVDGLAEGSPVGMAGMAWNVLTDGDFRNQMMNAFVEIAKDPVGFLGAMFTEYKDLLDRAMSGKATPEDMKKIGSDIGSMIAGTVSGGAITKIFSKVKAFQKLKLDARKPKADANSPTINCVSCFTALTLIETNEGPKEIKDISVGDSVLSFNESSGKVSFQRVEHVYQKYRDTIITIYALGTFIQTTNEHPFFVNGDWVRADKLKAGSLLTLASGEQASIDSVSFKLERTAVYNFSVENNHTYTVGNYRFLVHNCGPRSDLRANMEKRGVNMKGKHAHHIIPYSMRNNELVQLAQKAGFDINSLDNGMPLDPKFHIDYDAGNFHQAYSKLIQKELTVELNILKKSNKLTPENAQKAVEKVMRNAKNKINTGISQGAKSLDEVIR